MSQTRPSAYHPISGPTARSETILRAGRRLCRGFLPKAAGRITTQLWTLLREAANHLNFAYDGRVEGVEFLSGNPILLVGFPARILNVVTIKV